MTHTFRIITPNGRITDQGRYKIDRIEHPVKPGTKIVTLSVHGPSAVSVEGDWLTILDTDRVVYEFMEEVL
jgi:hypothetical protein